MKQLLTSFILLSGMLFFYNAATADVLLIERTQQQNQQPLPKHGQSMTQVEAQFGQPTIRHEAIGNPPISRWEYTDYVVYFEHELVLNSVMKRAKEITQP